MNNAPPIKMWEIPLNQRPELKNEIVLRNIVTIANGNNAHGDLFNRLVSEAFFSLGFEKPLRNLQEAGREMDIILLHRTEAKVAIVESKSTKEPVGGDAINKFIGAVSVEAKRFKKKGYQVVAYYVSQSGFKATAIRQEDDRKGADLPFELILMTPDMIVSELVRGNTICSAAVAGASYPLPQDTNLIQCGFADLLACKNGWIWALYYTTAASNIATHYCLVYSDGSPLPVDFAQEHFSEITNHSRFSELELIDVRSEYYITKDLKEVKRLYYQYLKSELGEISFEGLSPDKETGTIRVKLENIYVPIRFDAIRYNNDQNDSKKRLTTGQVVQLSQRATILAKPGGGKTTLIRRIALSYADSRIRSLIHDDIQDDDFFPVFIRCRDLGALTRKSIQEIIQAVIVRAELSQYLDAFLVLIKESMLKGTLYLLVDGLDEISDPQARRCFVEQLRCFSAMYPNARMLLTSRETGYSSIAGVLQEYCDEYRICSFDDQQIQELSLNWHLAIIPDIKKAKSESEQICKIILSSMRIKALADNPLLLTTLLFVKRCVGYLPTKKCQLYEEMIRLLLVSWNVAAHGSIDLDEAMPQLSYIAYYMSQKGVQTITKSDLLRCIYHSRKDLPEYLEYTQLSPRKFVDQVELRSNLLIQKGLEYNDREMLEETYEFSHLSLQEYLTAVAISKDWLPEKNQGLPVGKLLEGKLFNAQWAEIIPMTAFLLGKKAKPIIDAIIIKAEKDTQVKAETLEAEAGNAAALLLANCISLEVPMRDETLICCIKIIINNKPSLVTSADYDGNRVSPNSPGICEALLQCKYGLRYREYAEHLLLNDTASLQFLLSYIETFISCNRQGSASNKPATSVQMLAFSGLKDAITGLDYAINNVEQFLIACRENHLPVIPFISRQLASSNSKISILACILLKKLIEKDVLFDDKRYYRVDWDTKKLKCRIVRSKLFFSHLGALSKALVQFWLGETSFPNVVAFVDNIIIDCVSVLIEQLKDSFFLQHNPNNSFFSSAFGGYTKGYFPEYIVMNFAPWHYGERYKMTFEQYLASRANNPIVKTDTKACTILKKWIDCIVDSGILQNELRIETNAFKNNENTKDRFYNYKTHSYPLAVAQRIQADYYLDNMILGMTTPGYFYRWPTTIISHDYWEWHEIAWKTCPRPLEEFKWVINKPHALEIIEKMDK